MLLANTQLRSRVLPGSSLSAAPRLPARTKGTVPTVSLLKRIKDVIIKYAPSKKPSEDEPSAPAEPRSSTPWRYQLDASSYASPKPYLFEPCTLQPYGPASDAERAGGGGGDDGGAGGGGGDGGDGGDGGEDDSMEPRGHPLSVETALFGLAVAGGGIYGYMKKGSKMSILTGMGAGMIFVFCSILMMDPNTVFLGSRIALVLALAIAGVFWKKYYDSGKNMPAVPIATAASCMALAIVVGGGWVPNLV